MKKTGSIFLLILLLLLLSSCEMKKLEEIVNSDDSSSEISDTDSTNPDDINDPDNKPDYDEVNDISDIDNEISDEDYVDTPCGSVYFNGIDSYISVEHDDALNLGRTWTIEAWVMQDDLCRTNPIIIKGVKNPSFQIYGNEELSTGGCLKKPNAGYFYGVSSNDSYNLFSNQETTQMDWFHIALSVSENSSKLFINGTLHDQKESEKSIINNKAPLYFGVSLDDNPDFFAGIIDEIRLSSTARYTDNFNPEKRFRKDNETIALWHFDEQAGTETFSDGNINIKGLLNGSAEFTDKCVLKETDCKDECFAEGQQRCYNGILSTCIENSSGYFVYEQSNCTSDKCADSFSCEELPDDDYFPQCGNSIVDPNEICDSNTVECSNLLPGTEGYAKCNENCNGWEIESNCKRTVDCPDKPSIGTVWNDDGQNGVYIQTLEESNWIPELDTIHSDNPGDCKYKCSPNAEWNGKKCKMTFTKIASGSDSSCAISSGELYCWGDNSFSKLTNGTWKGNRPQPFRVGSNYNWEDISIGRLHSCGIASGKAYCWGYNFFGQIGNGENRYTYVGITEVVTNLTTDWKMISAGFFFNCGINNGELYCWGDNEYGQLGNGENGEGVLESTPQRIGSGNNWETVSSGWAHTCAIASGELYCWGNNISGMLGDGTTEEKLFPTRIGLRTDWENISAQTYFTCGIASGELYCWGEIPDYNEVSTTPVRIGTYSDWTDLTTGTEHVCGINKSELHCWGNNEYGQTGKTAPSSNNEPEKIGDSNTWQRVAAGNEHTCGINDGDVFCWGKNNEGQIGIGKSSYLEVPENIDNTNKWSVVQGGVWHSCGIKSGELYCWGNNYYRQLANETGFDIDYPVKIETSGNWDLINCGAYHNCGIVNGQLYCWGTNWYGQLGTGTSSSLTQPTQIGIKTDWKDVTAGYDFTCGIESGNLYCWGRNKYGQLGNGEVGDGSDYDVETPFKISELNTWKAVSAGQDHACAIASKDLYCWGDGSRGQLGIGTSFDTYVPTKVKLEVNWDKVSAGQYRTCGIADGELFCWGATDKGWVPDPRKISSRNDWTSVSAGTAVYGVASGELFYLEFNGSSDTQTKPVKIGTRNDWEYVGHGYEHVCGIAGGELYCWGNNEYGQVGNGEAWFDYPVQVN